MYLTTTIRGGKAQILHHDATGEPARSITSVTDTAVAAQLAQLLSGVEKDPQDTYWRKSIETLVAQLPSAVTAAVRTEITRYAPGTERIWTFYGHWKGNRIVVDYVLPGQVTDEREDTGQYPEGLWADSASATTQAEAQAYAIAQYETELIGECSVCRGTHLAPPAGETNGTEELCWYCEGEPI